MKYDAIVIGGGHNGLVTACYLARAKWRVLVLERRYVVGGACVTEEVFPGFKVSTAAYVNSLFRPEIIRDLRLHDYGFEAIERNPASFSPFLDGRYLDARHAASQPTSKRSRSLAGATPKAIRKYEAMLERVASVVEPTLTQIPPNLMHPSLGAAARSRQDGTRACSSSARHGRGDRSPHRRGAADSRSLVRIRRAQRHDRDRRDHRRVHGALDAGHGVRALPPRHGRDQRQTRRVELRARRHGRVDAGARSGRASDLGVEIRTDAEVAKILTRDGRVTGVALTNGDEFAAKTRRQRCRLPRDVREAARSVGAAAGVSRRRRAHLVQQRVVQDQRRAGAAAELHARCPATNPDRSISAPCISVRIRTSSNAPTTTRNTASSRANRSSSARCRRRSIRRVAPPGKHLMSMFTQYAPYRLNGGPWTDALRNEYADRCFDIVERYAPGFKDSVIDRQILTPVDLEATFGLTGGSIFQGAMPLHQLFAFRPVPGFASYKTPIRGLYLCGAAAHPGGGVMGAAGWNAARVMLRGH